MKFRIAAGVLIAAVLAAGAFLVPQVVDASAGGGWSHQGGEAWDAERILVRGFGSGTPNVVLLVDPVLATLDDPAVVETVTAMTDELASHTGITGVESYWTLGGADSYATEDGSQGLVTARIGGPESGLATRAETVLRQLDYDRDVIEVQVGGSAMVMSEARRATLDSLALLLVAFALSIVLLLVLLRNVFAAGLVALTSAVGVAGTVVALWGLERLTAVSTTAVLIALAVAWGTATAGGFVFARRFVTERRAGAERRPALVATMASAGRVVVAATAVSAVVLAVLAVMPTTLIRSTAYSATVAVVAAGIASVVVLGLLVSLFGAGVSGATGLPAAHDRKGLLGRIVGVAAARPVVTLVLTVVALAAMVMVALTGPLTGDTTASSLPASSPTRQVADVLDEQVPANEVDAPYAVGPFVEFGAGPEQLAEYTAAVSAVPGVARADSTEGSFAAGDPVEVPPELTERLENDRAYLVRAPLGVAAESAEARTAVDQVDAVNAPYRADIGGATARHVATAAAMESRIPILVVAALLAVVLIAGWLLHGWRVGLRLAFSALFVAGGAWLVIRFGFVDGMASGLLGSSPVDVLDAFVSPLAWALGLALAAGWLVLAWGAGREAHDVTAGSSGAPLRSLAATGWTHLGAAALLWLPFLALVVNDWRSQQMIALAVVGVGVLTATVGRFVVVPALFAIAPGRLWPRQVDGTADPMFPDTAAAKWLVGAVAEAAPEAATTASPVAVPAPVAATRPVEESAGAGIADDGPAPGIDEGIAAAADLDAWERSGGSALAVAASPVASSPIPAAEATTADDDAGSDERTARMRRRSRWRRSDPAPDIEMEVETAVDESVATTSAVPAAVADATETAMSAVTDASEDTRPAGMAPVDADPAMATSTADEDSETAAAPMPAIDGPAVSEGVAAMAAAVGLAAVESDGAMVPDAVDGQGTDEAVDALISTEPPGEPSFGEDDRAALEDTSEPGDDVMPSAADDDVMSGDESLEHEPTGDPVAAVDVVSLTESVIASLEADVPFTTEIGSGFVSNPSNNLSRVMEAILRDASRRGGEEVLVYGHAAAGRYRWMVVDSGPRADHDPERARTLAEAQRFIRRVGGVVECRPEGDFTVFVVEIPMAS